MHDHSIQTGLGKGAAMVESALGKVEVAPEGVAAHVEHK